MSSTQPILDRAAKVMISNYARLPIVMSRGEGAHVWDVDGKQYLDFFAGFGGAILGHANPDLIAAITAQAAKLWHVGNVFHTEPQVELAERLNKFGFEGKAFFCHGGADANEAALKLARLRGHDRGRWKIISFNQSFHGRSLATIAATGNPKVREGFDPETPGFIRITFNDLPLLEKTIDEQTAGIILEPIQGEGGINLPSREFIIGVRKLCDAHGLTLIFDEVWTGCGRTGKMFGHQYFTDDSGNVVTPDIMTLGKALGGGLPVGAMFAKPPVADLFVPGKHGSTLGGNPICMVAAKTVFDVIARDGLLERAAILGERAISRLRNEKRIEKSIADIRGHGLMLGIELHEPPSQLPERALERGLIINVTAQKVIRLAPPLTISDARWDEGLGILIDLLAAG